MFKSANSQGKPFGPKRVPKFKRIHKILEDKLASFFKHERNQKEQMHIYVDSSEEEIKSAQLSSIKPHKPLLNAHFKKESSKEDLDNQSLEDQPIEDEWLSSQSNLSRIAWSHEVLSPILKADLYVPVKEIDFQLYTTFLARTKIYGSLLIDQFGRFLWCDKTTHQLLQGSLNNFQRMTIQNFLLTSQVDNFLQEMRSICQYNQKTTFRWIVYSKNSKRRFFKIPLPKNPNIYDIFYRFLKYLAVRIRPISICLPTYRDPNGFCNQKLLPDYKTVNCFFLELRYAKQTPNLKGMDIEKDPVIQKFLANTKAKIYSMGLAKSFTPYRGLEQREFQKPRQKIHRESKEETVQTKIEEKRIRKHRQHLEGRQQKAEDIPAKKIVIR